ncbi:MAG: uracil-DNA glycosylase [Clostridiales bacterium]|jgi:uracil-DNA glycosylase|nr:uracil-DNA glycosylase [Clostridiales bacterium]
MKPLGNDWDNILKGEFEKDYYLELRGFLKKEYFTKVIYPPMGDIYNALKYTPYENTKVVILGQDPYKNPGEAHGLSFSVLPGAKTPPSLRNVYKELNNDLGCYIPNNGYLIKWAGQGVMMLNTVLTLVAGRSKSHAGKGWETFTDRVIQIINKKETPVVFLLWGKDAGSKSVFINNPRHLVLKSVHPSPLAGNGFIGCGHFSKANEFLKSNGISEIDWQIENI